MATTKSAPKATPKTSNSTSLSLAAKGKAETQQQAAMNKAKAAAIQSTKTSNAVITQSAPKPTINNTIVTPSTPKAVVQPAVLKVNPAKLGEKGIGITNALQAPQTNKPATIINPAAKKELDSIIGGQKGTSNIARIAKIYGISEEDAKTYVGQGAQSAIAAAKDERSKMLKTRFFADVLPSVTPAPTQAGINAGKTPVVPQTNAAKAPTVYDAQSIFNDIKAGKLIPSRDNGAWTKLYEGDKASGAQQEAYRMWEKYNKLKDAKGAALTQALEKGEIAVDDPVWNALKQNGQLTKTQEAALNVWGAQQKVAKTTAAKPKPTTIDEAESIEELNNLLNENQYKEFDQSQNQDLIPPTKNGEAQLTPTNLTAPQNLQNNIEALSNTLNSGQYEAPTIPELSKTYQQLYTKYNIDDAENLINQLDETEASLSANLRKIQAGLIGETVSTDVIEGRVSTAERNMMERIDAVSRQKKALTNQVTVANNLISSIMGYQQMDYNNASDAYNKQFNNNIQTLNQLRGLNQDQLDQQQLDKTTAEANLQILYNMAASGQINVDDLPDSQKKLWSKLEAQAGLPAGTYENILNQNVGQEMVGSGTQRVDAEGNVYMDFIMRDKETGAITTVTQPLGADYQSYLGLRKAEADIAYTQASAAGRSGGGGGRGGSGGGASGKLLSIDDITLLNAKYPTAGITYGDTQASAIAKINGEIEYDDGVVDDTISAWFSQHDGASKEEALQDAKNTFNNPNNYAYAEGLINDYYAANGGGNSWLDDAFNSIKDRMTNGKQEQYYKGMSEGGKAVAKAAAVAGAAGSMNPGLLLYNLFKK